MGQWALIEQILQIAVAAATAKVTIPATQVSFSKIMVATDLSPASEHALEYAVSIARRFGSKIYLNTSSASMGIR